ncbi:CWC16 protein [Parasitella parasitica]|nr:CWC16 protein [Parasitella parasitica]
MQPFNKYYPPDWTPEKGSINTHYGKHALGDRARKLDEGILIVRFELPFNIWCSGCENHIGQGVRYNAQKKQIGKYYSTPILQFRMKCHLCDNWIEIHTDPKNTAYVVVSGARKKVEEWNPDDTEVIQLQDKEQKEQLESDPMYRLEHGIKDKQIIQEAIPHLTQLQTLNESQWLDPYSRSQQLRKQFRQEKKKDKLEREETEKLRDKHSLQIELLPETTSDVIEAKSIEYNAAHVLDEKRLDAAVSPLFSRTAKNNSSIRKLGLGRLASVRTRLKTDPFYHPKPFTAKLTKDERPTKLNDVKVVKPVQKKRKAEEKTATASTSMLVSYSESDTD